DAAASLSDLPEGDGLVPARDVVTAPDGVLGVLAHVLVADDLDAALAAAPALTTASRALTIVTRAGEIVTAHTLRAGSGEGRSRLELSAQREAAAERLGELPGVAEAHRAELAAATSALQEARARTKTALETLRAHDSALAAHTEKLNKATV